MSLNARPFDELSAEDIEGLVNAEIPEGRQIEYKEVLPGGSDADKREFLYDVSSFANAAGGDLVYGVKEEKGVAVEVVPLKDVDPDKEILRLEAIALAGVDPRVPGLRTKAISTDGGLVLVVRIPRSWDVPHMVTASGVSRFYSRTSAGKYQLDVREIKALSILSDSAEQRIRDFRSERLARLVADDVAFSLGSGPKLALHVAPVGAAFGGGSIDLSPVAANPTAFRPPSGWGFDWRHNLDGFATYAREAEGQRVTGYSQVFRDGRVECVDGWVLTAMKDRKAIATRQVEDDLIERTIGAVAVYEKLGVAPPVVVMISLTGVRGFELLTGAAVTFRTHAIDRDVVILPEVILHDFSSDVATALRPAFDALWNAGGWPSSQSYSESGDRLPRR